MTDDKKVEETVYEFPVWQQAYGRDGKLVEVISGVQRVTEQQLLDAQKDIEFKLLEVKQLKEAKK